MVKKYLLGLDLGTNSVGWCVTDENNKIVKKGGKSLWGARLFEEAQDASSRRANRIARRRTQRRAERIDLLQMLFKEEIDKIDSTFFLRLNQSMYHKEDKDDSISNFDNLLFVDDSFNDFHYYKKFPTIYHLRKYLYDTNEKADIRLLYLALAHMVKYRGNFLIEGEFKANDSGQITLLFKNLKSVLLELPDENSCSIELKENFADEFNAKVLKAKGVSAKKEALETMFGKDKYLKIVIFPLIAGSEVDTAKIFSDYEGDIDPDKISFSKADYDDKYAKLSEFFPNDLRIEMISILKGIYDYVLLGKLLGDKSTISEAMIERYDTHKADLKKLKAYIKANIPEKYNEVFRLHGGDKEINNYVNYVGSTNSNLGKLRCKHCDQDGFYKYIKKILKIDDTKFEEIQDDFLKDIYTKIADKSYLPRQNSTDNGVFPYQLNLTEMKKILEIQKSYYPFLEKKDDDGISTIEKIESLLTFKIPYYVGPLMPVIDGNPRSSHSWMVRKDDKTKIYPWNFKQIVDEDQSAEKFIKRMLNKCTYLPDCYCLPLNSLLFQRYRVLEVLNKLLINGMPLTKVLKEELINEVFKKNKTVTKKKIEDYLTNKYEKPNSITTSNEKEVKQIDASLSSYVFFSNVLGEEYVKNNESQIEQIIKDLTIFEDKKIIERRLSKYHFTEKQINEIKSKKMTGWGRLSKEFLTMTTRLFNEATGEYIDKSLIEVMNDTNFNLMELINDTNYDFKRKIEEANFKDRVTYKDHKEKHEAIVKYVDECYVSPGMKRPLIQAMSIIEDVEKILGSPIDEYYVECTRTNKAEKKVKDSRQKHLQELYEQAKKLAKAEIKNSADKERVLSEIDYFSNKVKNENELSKFRSDKYYLYLLQLGKCMYTLKPISLADINDNSKYDVDHIIPQAMLKDDSIENRVLVCSEANRYKKAIYPVLEELISPGAKAFYKNLYKLGLMGEKKYNNLIRTKPLSDSDLIGFVNRQLVYTNQAVKALVDTIKRFQVNKDGNPPKVIYSKGENVSDFRKDFDIVKCRDANSFHHAHDAYLNICVGRAINTYYGDFNYFKYQEFKENKRSFNPKKIFCNNERDGSKSPLLDSDGNVVWDYKTSISEIKKNIFTRFDVLTTTMQYIKGGQLTNATINPKGDNLVPVKENGPLSNTKKYGGKSGVTYSIYSLVEFIDGKKKKRLIAPIPLSQIKGKYLTDNIIDYLSSKYGYKDIKVLIPCLRINSVLRNKSSRVCLSGVCDEMKSYYVKNLSEIHYSETELRTIKKIRKMLDIISRKKLDMSKEDFIEKVSKLMIFSTDSIIISPAANERTKAVVLTNGQLDDLYNKFVTMNKKHISLFKSSFAIIDLLTKEETKAKFNFLNIFEKSKIVMELVLYFNSSIQGANLSLIGGPSKAGKARISSNIPSGIDIIAESPTGFFTKTLWKAS